MTTGRVGLGLALGAAVLAVGCVDRRFLVETNVPGAQIYVDDKPIGPSPADARWEYAGCYKFTAVAPGYQPTVQRVEFEAKWFEYPPFDFFAEVLWPFRIEDRRLVQLTLEPMQPVNEAALVAAADALRARGQSLPPTSVPRTEQPPPAITPVPPTGVAPIQPVPFGPPLGVTPNPFPAGTPSRDPLPVPPGAEPITPIPLPPVSR